MVLLKHHGNAGAKHEDDLPVACPFFEEGRFEPILLRGTGGVGDATFVDVSNPSAVAADVDVGVRSRSTRSACPRHVGP
jgi:hypothetical protein